MKLEELRQGQLVWPTVMLDDEESDEEIAGIERLPLDKIDKPATVVATSTGLMIVDAGNLAWKPSNYMPESTVMAVTCDTDADGYHLTLAAAIDAGAKLCEETAAIETKRAAAMRKLAERARKHDALGKAICDAARLHSAAKMCEESDTIRTVPREPGDPEWAQWVARDTEEDNSKHKLWVFEIDPKDGDCGWWSPEGLRDKTQSNHGLQPGEKARLAPIK